MNKTHRWYLRLSLIINPLLICSSLIGLLAEMNLHNQPNLAVVYIALWFQFLMLFVSVFWIILNAVLFFVFLFKKTEAQGLTISALVLLGFIQSLAFSFMYKDDSVTSLTSVMSHVIYVVILILASAISYKFFRREGAEYGK